MAKKEITAGYNDADSAWKEIIETYLEQFLAFLFPKIYSDIDLERGYEFLDKELEKITNDAEIGKRHADKLIKIFLNDGTEKWILIHIEVQGYRDESFAERMFTYNYRIFDRYHHEVISLAILTDENHNYRPSKYEIKRWGFELTFKFPLVKLLDYRSRVTELEESDNPFAIILLAHLKTAQTRKNHVERLRWKIDLAKSLYKKGLSGKDIINLYRFIDWLMYLPKEANLKFHNEMRIFEEKINMAYITPAQHIDRDEGKAEEIMTLYRNGDITPEVAKRRLQALHAEGYLSKELYEQYLKEISQ